jgi:penicillin-binding protein 2
MTPLRRPLSLLLIIVLTLTACDIVQPVPETPPPTTGGGDGTATDAVPTPINLTTADGAAQAYLNAWQAGDYAAMYALLSPSVQQQITVEQFSAQYTDAMTAMTAQGVTLDVDMTKLGVTPTTARLPFAVTYETVALGPLTRDLALSLKLEGTTWTVLWDSSMILPELAGGKVLSLSVESPDRANIYDRNGQWLVQSNSPTATISVIPALVGDEDEENDLLDVLSRALRMPPSLIKSNYSGNGPAYEQPIAVGDIDQEVLDNIWDTLYNYEAVSIAGGKFGRRNYYNLAPHILGYTGYIPAEQLQDYVARGYPAEGAIVGLSGLEYSQEDILAGKRGGTLTACLSDGTLCSQVASRASEPALNVYTTIDRDLQTITQDALEDAYRAGSLTWAPEAGGAAAIVMDVKTGEILAIASYPYFDANIFNPNNGNPMFTNNYLNALGADPRRPYFNRATSGAQPPGSIFKIVTLAATLDSGVYAPEDRYVCDGVWEHTSGDRLDWKEGGHGDISLIEALMGSCNPWFYRMGLAMGGQDFNILPDIAKGFGLGARTGVEIDEEPGVVPDPAWMQQTLGETWSIDDSINMAVGQGNLLVTPIQMVNVTSAIANGGTLYRPHLIKAIGPALEAPTNIVEPQVNGTIPITDEQIASIREGMLGVTTIIDLGTAENRVGGMDITTAGKTGTAQVSSGAQPIAWYTGYAPYEDPEIAVIIMVENGGQGSTIASPIFRRIVEMWYGLRVFHWPDDWLDPELYEAVKDIGE